MSKMVMKLKVHKSNSKVVWGSVDIEGVGVIGISANEDGIFVDIQNDTDILAECSADMDELTEAWKDEEQ